MTADSAGIADPGAYRIDPAQSVVHYSGKHMFGLGTVRATFRIKEGAVQIGNPVTTSTARVTVDASSFTSDNARRDKDVRSARLLDTASYPDITFASERVQEAGDRWVVSGTVRAHGEAIPVEVQIDRIAPESNGIRVHGRTAHLDRTALGVTGAKGMVGRYLDLELDVLALPE
jgi:polyisoprenoid-binding protein YceI